MKQVRTHAFAMPAAGLWLHPHEVAALVGLPSWFFALFAHLVLRSDFRNGNGRTGYGEIGNALTPDQPERGPRLVTPSKRELIRAVDRLEQLRVVARDKAACDAFKVLIFEVAPRGSRGVPAEKLAPELAPASTREKGRNSHQNSHHLSALNFSAINSPPTPPLVDNFSAPVHVAESLRATRSRAAAKNNLK